jgi:glycosyltransferase involved in cell wall biosynthesis
MILGTIGKDIQKICIITDQFPPYPEGIFVLKGGIDIGLKQLSDEFRKQGYAVIIITQEYIKKLKVPDEPYIRRIRTYIPYSLEKGMQKNGMRFIINETFNPLTFGKVYKILKKESPDAIILGACHQLSLAPVFAALLLNIPVHNRYDWPCPLFPKTKPCYYWDRVKGCGVCIEKYTNTTVGRATGLVLGLITASVFKLKVGLWKKSKSILPVNQFYAEMYSAFGVPKEKIHVIPTSRPIEKVPLTTKKFLQLRDNSKFILLYVGRLSPEKGIMMLMDSMKTVQKHNNGVRLLIAGDGIMRDEVEKIADNNSQITYLGWLSKEQLSELYQITDAVVIPSTVPEGHPRSAEEIMSFNKTIIGFDIGGLHEIFEKYPNNVRVNKVNSQELARGIIKCIEGIGK